MTQVLGLTGMPGMHLVRIDHCTAGTPYQKPQLWLTTNQELCKEGAVCYHPLPHEEAIAGGNCKQSAPYPPKIAENVTHAWTRTLPAVLPNEMRKLARYMLSSMFPHEGDALDGYLHDEFVATGRKMHKAVRGKAPSISSIDVVDVSAHPLTAPAAAASSSSSAEPAPVADDADSATSSIMPTGGHNAFEKGRVLHLQRQDADFRDVIMAFETQQELPEGHAGDKLFKELRKRFKIHKATAANVPSRQ